MVLGMSYAVCLDIASTVCRGVYKGMNVGLSVCLCRKIERCLMHGYALIEYIPVYAVR